jgi:hypothetical protein
MERVSFAALSSPYRMLSTFCTVTLSMRPAIFIVTPGCAKNELDIALPIRAFGLTQRWQ